MDVALHLRHGSQPMKSAPPLLCATPCQKYALNTRRRAYELSLYGMDCCIVLM